MNRRQFLGSAAAAAAFTIVPRHVLAGSGTTAPSEKLNIACIGIGGQGASDIQSVSSENIVALCDVDWGNHTAGTFKAFPNARKYKDFRVMLDKEDKNIDAVTVSTPDNLHAVASMAAMKRGKHVYCEKPLCHDVYEVRQLTEAARKYKVVTQMGTQIHGTAEMKMFVEIVQSGIIGKIHKVDLWSGKNWGGGVRPTDTLRSPRRWTGICGSDPPRTGPIIRATCRATGDAGWTSGPAPWATWAATSSTPLGGLSIWAIRRASPPSRVRSARKPIRKRRSSRGSSRPRAIGRA